MVWSLSKQEVRATVDNDEYYDAGGLKRETEFLENGFGIDPEGCGCTDCLIGEAFHPSDTWKLGTAIKQGRTLYNRTGHEVILPNGYRLDDGEAWRPVLGDQRHCPGCNCR
jgi:hypothetical protein